MRLHEYAPLPPHGLILYFAIPKESDVPTKRHKVHASALGKGMAGTQSHVEQIFRGGTTGATDFVLSVLSKAHPQYPSLCHQFVSKWLKPGMPRVLRILEVKVSV